MLVPKCKNYNMMISPPAGLKQTRSDLVGNFRDHENSEKQAYNTRQELVNDLKAVGTSITNKTICNAGLTSRRACKVTLL